MESLVGVRGFTWILLGLEVHGEHTVMVRGGLVLRSNSTVDYYRIEGGRK